MSQVVTTQPGARNNMLLVGLDGHREWSSGLFKCTDDVVNSLITCCCFSCMLCKLSVRMHEFFLMPICSGGGFMAMRTKIRTMGGISGSMCEDCLMTGCCGPCALCQMNREMDAIGL